jgi:hypothetical protein
VLADTPERSKQKHVRFCRSRSVTQSEKQFLHRVNEQRPGSFAVTKSVSQVVVALELASTNR